MKIIFLLIFQVVLLLFLNGCKDESPTSPPNLETQCFSFYDSETNAPLDSVFVEITFRNLDTKIYSYQNYFTGTSKSLCVQVDSRSSLVELRANRYGYMFYGPVPVSEIYLAPLSAQLQLHIKNIPPQAEDDLLEVFTMGLTFTGSNIDTTITENFLPGEVTFSWRSTHNNVVENYSKNYVYEKHKTTYVEILY